MPDQQEIPKDSTVLAFDYGLARIGVAIGNLLTRTARPLQIISWKTNTAKWTEIGKLFAEWQPQAAVVGIPSHKDGNPTSVTPACKRFANQLRGRYNVPVFGVDEQFSSEEAQSRHLGEKYIDDEAASVILERWLSSYGVNHESNHR